MKLFNTIILSLVVIFSFNFSYSMENPQVLSKANVNTLKSSLNGYRDPKYFSSKSDKDLENIIDFARKALVNEKVIIFLSKTVKNFPSNFDKNPASIKQMLNELITKATNKLAKTKAGQKQKKAIPVLKQMPNEQKQISLKKYIEAQLNGNATYLTTRSNLTLEAVIASATMALTDPGQLAAYEEEFQISRKQLRDMLAQIIQQAKLGLKQAQVLQEVNQNIIEPAIKNEPILAPIEQEVHPNRLYIGLDVKNTNTNDQPILWQGPIDTMISKMNNTEFLPNDYFHITIAWYESKNPIAPEVVVQVERALAHASQILKIVFPHGVTGIGLLDGAVLLGKNKDSVTFRVAESVDLKKLQEILLQFLSFEKIEGFKFNTFDKETPIHVTLGKIRPSKLAPQFHNIATNLHAPEGARASLGQSFTINTFRLTYSLAGQAWQEKMSYKF